MPIDINKSPMGGGLRNGAPGTVIQEPIPENVAIESDFVKQLIANPPVPVEFSPVFEATPQFPKTSAAAFLATLTVELLTSRIKEIEGEAAALKVLLAAVQARDDERG
jgi:hypothetical protein